MKDKLTENWEEDVWKSLDELDVMHLRSTLKNILIQTENEFQSYNMNRTENLELYG